MAKYPQKIGSIVSELMTRRGYAQVQSSSELQGVFERVVGRSIAAACTLGSIKRGTLEIAVSNSVVVQELSFQKQQLIKAIKKEYPQSGVSDIRFRVS